MARSAATHKRAGLHAGRPDSPLPGMAGTLPRRVAGSLHRGLAYAVIGLGLAFAVLPFLWMAATSLRDGWELLTQPRRWLPVRPTLANYGAVLQELPFAVLFRNSFLVAATVTVAQVTSGAMAGYVFARGRFRGRDFLFALYLGTMIVPDHVTVVPAYVLLRWLGLLDTYSALTLPFLAGPFSAFMMRQFFRTVPDSLEEAARIDGCGQLATLFRIVLPVSVPAVLALGTLTFVWNWNSFLWPLLVTTRPGLRTLPVGLATFRTELGVEWPLLMAGVLLAILPVLVVFTLSHGKLTAGVVPNSQ